jgi:hypothetical protein
VPTTLAIFPGDSTIRKFAQIQHNVDLASAIDESGAFRGFLE